MLHFNNAGTGSDVVAIVDPLSNDAQKLIPVLMVSMYGIRILRGLFVNCVFCM